MTAPPIVTDAAGAKLALAKLLEAPTPVGLPLYALEQPVTAWRRASWRFEVGYLLPTGRGVEHVQLGRGASWDGALENARRKIRGRARRRVRLDKRAAGALRQLPLLVTLACTLPAYKAARPGGAILCSPGTAPTIPAVVELWGQVQSRTWVDSSAAMEADPATWARLEPKVRAEAEPFMIERNPGGAPGSSYHVVTPASPWALFYFLRVEDPAGHVSCASSTVGLP